MCDPLTFIANLSNASAVPLDLTCVAALQVTFFADLALAFASVF